MDETEEVLASEREPLTSDPEKGREKELRKHRVPTQQKVCTVWLALLSMALALVATGSVGVVLAVATSTPRHRHGSTSAEVNFASAETPTSVVVFMASNPENHLVKDMQDKINRELTAKGIYYQKIEVDVSPQDMQKMRGFSGAGSMPPQISNGDQYCGDYSLFESAVNEGRVEDFLRLQGRSS